MTALTGAGALIRLIIRRDRLPLAIWALLAVGIPLANTVSLAALLPTPEARADFVADSMANPVINAMLGPIPNSSIEAIVAWRSNSQGVLVAALASLLLVVRHTRAEEEAGRRELLGSAPVGRHAGLTAVLGFVFAANLLIALVLAAVLVVGVGYPAAGSFAFALSLAAAGWFFAAAAGVAAQLTQSAAPARSMGVGILGVAFLPALFSEGAEASRLSWLSPIGWTRFTRAYAEERWWVFLIFLAVVAALTAAAYVLAARRDLDAGMLPERSGGIGPSRAASGLRSPLALAWRLHKDDLVGWCMGVTLFGAALGWQATTFDELFADVAIVEEWLAAAGGETLGEAFLALLSFDLRLVVACLAIVTALRLRTEEVGGRVGPLLAGPTGRSRWMSSHLVVAFVGPSAILLLAGLCAGLSYGLTTGRPEATAGHFATAVLFLPAAWFMTAITIALFGLLPRVVVPASWGIMVVFVILVLLWEVRAIGQRVFLLAPFGYNHPAVESDLVAPIVVTLFAALLTAVGVFAFRRRDVSE